MPLSIVMGKFMEELARRFIFSSQSGTRAISIGGNVKGRNSAEASRTVMPLRSPESTGHEALFFVVAGSGRRSVLPPRKKKWPVNRGVPGWAERKNASAV